jgi:hypothetical protein
MDTANAAATMAAPQMLSSGSRLASAVAVVALVSFCWVYAESASRDAVLSATEHLAPGRTYVTLPSVQIVGRRGAGGLSSATDARIA